MTPYLTAAGQNVLLRALLGEKITFTKVQIGNGETQEPTTAVQLINPLMSIPITKMEKGDTYAALTATFNNSEITYGFHITEIGFFVEDPDDTEQEILYAIGHEDVSTADYVPDKNNRVFDMQIDGLLFIGEAQNIAAIINSSLVYASPEELKEHTDAKNNPHNVTAEQVGLGNVPDVSTNDQTPTYVEAKSLAELSSGERLSIAFGKIKLAISKLIQHLSNEKNPHKVTAKQAGAAAESHTHGAADINSGVLSVQRGGTGCSNDLELNYFIRSLLFRTREYTGTGTKLTLSHKGKKIWCALVFAVDGSFIGMATQTCNSTIAGANPTYSLSENWDQEYCTVGIVGDGVCLTNDANVEGKQYAALLITD